MDDLADVLGPREVTKPVLPEVQERDAPWWVVPDKGIRRIGHDDLSAVGMAITLAQRFTALPK